MPELPTTREELSRMLFCAFRAGFAYGQDGLHPEPGQSDREAMADLFCEYFPGLEAGADCDRAKDTETRRNLFSFINTEEAA